MVLRTAVICAVALACLDKQQAAAAEPDLQGSWKLMTAERDGKRCQTSLTKLVFKRGRVIEIHETTPRGQFVSVGQYKVRQRGELMELDEGDTTADGKPVQERDKTGELSYVPSHRGIYKIEQDKLTICWQSDGARPRPKAFKTQKGDQAELLVLRRPSDNR